MRIIRSLLVGFVAILLVASVFGTVIGTGVSVEDEFLSCVGVAEEDAVEIYNWYDLNDIRENLSADYILMNDLDKNTEGYDELVDTEDGWEPIGDDDNKFAGTFDGNGYDISDLNIKQLRREDVGLFGSVREGAEVTDVALVDADVNDYWHVGGLVGQNYGLVSNSYATGTVSSEVDDSNFVGGLVGVNSGTVESSYAMVDVSGEQLFIGGLVGRNQGVVSNSYAMGDVSGGGLLGGLVGSNEGTVENSYSTGYVSGSNRNVGGLVGSNSGTLSNSYARVEVDGSYRAGGLVGYNSGMVENSYAMGDVRDGLLAGGLVGYNHGGTLSNSYATGDVSGNSPIGGLVGTNSGKIENSYSTGEVRRGLLVYNNGGLVGLNDDGGVSDSYWDTDTSGLDDSDGGTGLTTDEMTGGNALNNMDGFDFEETWETVEEAHEDAEEDGYPILQGLNREEQLQYVYPADPVEDVDIIDEIREIPGFTSLILMLAVIIAVAIYKKKKR